MGTTHSPILVLALLGATQLADRSADGAPVFRLVLVASFLMLFGLLCRFGLGLVAMCLVECTGIFGNFGRFHCRFSLCAVGR